MCIECAKLHCYPHNDTGEMMMQTPNEMPTSWQRRRDEWINHKKGHTQNYSMLVNWSMLILFDDAKALSKLAFRRGWKYRVSTFFGSARKKDLFIFVFNAFFGGSCSCSSAIARSQFAILAAVSGSRRRFCICWETADSRRAADGLRVCFAG